MKSTTKQYIELIVKKIMGLDLTLDSAPAQDEEVWRTTTNKGKGENTHYKIDTATGKITAGFGGKYNGQTPSQAFQGNNEENNEKEQQRPAMQGHTAGTLTKQQQQIISTTVVNAPQPDPKHKNWVKGTIQSQGQQWHYALNTQTGQYWIKNNTKQYALAKNGTGNYTHNAFGAAMLQEWKDQMLADWNIDVDAFNYQPKQKATQTPSVAPTQPTPTQTPNTAQVAQPQPPQPQQTANNRHWIAPGVSAREMAHMGANYPTPTATQIAYINANTNTLNHITPSKRKGWFEGTIIYQHPQRGQIQCPFQINKTTGEYWIKNSTKQYALAKNGKGDYAVDGACAALADWLKNRYGLPTFTGKGNATPQPQATPTPQPQAQPTPQPQAATPIPTATPTPSAPQQQPQAQPQQPKATQTTAQKIKAMKATIKPSSNAQDDIDQKITLKQAERVARVDALFNNPNPTPQDMKLQATILNNAGLISDKAYQKFLNSPWKWDATVQNRAKRMISALKQAMQPRSSVDDHKRIDAEMAQLTTPAKINAWVKKVKAQSLDPNDYNVSDPDITAVQQVSVALGLDKSPQIVEDMKQLKAAVKGLKGNVQGQYGSDQATNPGIVYRRDDTPYQSTKSPKFIQYQQTTDTKFRVSNGCCPLNGGLYTNTHLSATHGYGETVKAYALRKDAKLCTVGILRSEMNDPQYAKEAQIASAMTNHSNSQYTIFAMLRGYDALVGRPYCGGENAIILNRAATITLDPTTSNIYVLNYGAQMSDNHNTIQDLKTQTQ